MDLFRGTLALKLDFGGVPATVTSTAARAAWRPQPAAAPRLVRLEGAGKYRVLERRRRAAQIRARHLLQLMEEGQ
jgi:hypothetical protein